jgi:hypothetical protein
MTACGKSSIFAVQFVIFGKKIVYLQYVKRYHENPPFDEGFSWCTWFMIERPQLLNIGAEKELLTHPKSGASWEGYVVEEVIRAIEPNEVFFWATHQGAEIDLVLIKDGHMLGVECKRVDAPRMTPSIRIALEDLQLNRTTKYSYTTLGVLLMVAQPSWLRAQARGLCHQDFLSGPVPISCGLI